MWSFLPVRLQPSGVRVARVRVRATSEPPWGSVSAGRADGAVHQLREHRAVVVVVAVLHQGPYEAGVGDEREHEAQVLARAGDVGDVFGQVRPGPSDAAQVLGDAYAPQAEVGQALPGQAVEDLGLVGGVRPTGDVGPCERGERVVVREARAGGCAGVRPGDVAGVGHGGRGHVRWSPG
ncbi:hypothetical protein GCM10020227_27530 [Streptomyces flavovirens]